MRPTACHRDTKASTKSIIFLPGRAYAASHVDPVAETVFIVRAGIEARRAAMFRGDAGQSPCIAPFCLSEYPCPGALIAQSEGCVPHR